MRVTDKCTVISRNLTIVIYIFHLILTNIICGIQAGSIRSTIRQYRTTCIVLIIQDLFLALVDTIQHITVELTDRMVFHHNVHIRDTSSLKDTRICTDVGQNILIVRQVYANRIINLANLIVPVQVQVDTCILHVTNIYFRFTCATSQSRPVRIDQHIRSILDIIVKVRSQTLIQSGQVKTGIKHL